MVTMFVLSVVNNWNILTEQFVLVSGTTAARLFSVVNFYVGVACLLQVLNTFIITTLWQEYAQNYRCAVSIAVFIAAIFLHIGPLHCTLR
jgi:hypothetical protein